LRMKRATKSRIERQPTPLPCGEPLFRSSV
jgi:hypothetical protein